MISSLGAGHSGPLSMGAGSQGLRSAQALPEPQGMGVENLIQFSSIHPSPTQSAGQPAEGHSLT